MMWGCVDAGGLSVRFLTQKDLTRLPETDTMPRTMDITEILNDKQAIHWQGSTVATIRASLDESQAAEIAPATLESVILDALKKNGTGFTLQHGLGGWEGETEEGISVSILGRSTEEIQPAVSELIDAIFQHTPSVAVQVELTEGGTFQTAEVRPAI